MADSTGVTDWRATLPVRNFPQRVTYRDNPGDAAQGSERGQAAAKEQQKPTSVVDHEGSNKAGLKPPGPNAIYVLPTEVMCAMADLLPTEDILQLRLVSKTFSNMVDQAYLIKRDIAARRFHALAHGLIKRDTELIHAVCSLGISLNAIPLNIILGGLPNSARRDFIFTPANESKNPDEDWIFVDLDMEIDPLAPPHLMVPDLPLCLAAMDMDTAFAEFLLMRGVSPNRRSMDRLAGRKRPLELLLERAVAKQGNVCPLVMTRLLLHHGADPDAGIESLFSESGHSAVESDGEDTFRPDIDEEIGTPLRLALQAGAFPCRVHPEKKTSCVVHLVQALVDGDHGGRVNPGLYNSTRLARAVEALPKKEDRRLIVEILLDGGSDPDAFEDVTADMD